MKRIQSLLLAVALVAFFSISVLAGHIESGIVPDPPPAESYNGSWVMDAYGVLLFIFP